MPDSTTDATAVPPDAVPEAGGEGAAGIDIERRIDRTGSDLVSTLSNVLDAVPDRPQGPQALATRIEIDKVLASRVLRAVRASDPMSALHRLPGPDPLRRLLRAARKHGVEDALIDPATAAVDRFASLLRDELGDRGALDAIVSAWVPEARREFELRRKQSLFKATSQLKGLQADAIVATAILSVGSDPNKLDLVWLSGLVGLQRLRPGAGCKFATRRMTDDDDARRPATLDGRPVETMDDAVVPEFSSEPTPRIDVVRAGESVHYLIADAGFGPRSMQDIVIGEVNRNEMRRAIGRDEDREGFLFAEVSVPARALQFDVILHRDVYPGNSPRLRLYDTSFEGVADINDRARDIDRLDMLESIEPLGLGIERIGSAIVPRYGALVHHVCERLGWDPSAFRAFRCRIDHPVYGSQVAMCFDPPRE